jgi:hypothetical protein
MTKAQKGITRAGGKRVNGENFLPFLITTHLPKKCQLV